MDVDGVGVAIASGVVVEGVREKNPQNLPPPAVSAALPAVVPAAAAAAPAAAPARAAAATTPSALEPVALSPRASRVPPGFEETPDEGTPVTPYGKRSRDAAPASAAAAAGEGTPAGAETPGSVGGGLSKRQRTPSLKYADDFTSGMGGKGGVTPGTPHAVTRLADVDTSQAATGPARRGELMLTLPEARLKRLPKGYCLEPVGSVVVPWDDGGRPKRTPAEKAEAREREAEARRVEKEAREAARAKVRAEKEARRELDRQARDLMKAQRSGRGGDAAALALHALPRPPSNVDRMSKEERKQWKRELKKQLTKVDRLENVMGIQSDKKRDKKSAARKAERKRERERLREQAAAAEAAAARWQPEPEEAAEEEEPEADVTLGPRHMRSLMDVCKNILNAIRRHRDAWPFLEPVDVVALKLDDYYDVVKQPMDLGTVSKKLDQEKYPHPDDFAADMRLVFTNAQLYNAPEVFIHKLAGTLLAQFDKKYSSMPNKIHQQMEKARAEAAKAKRDAAELKRLQALARMAPPTPHHAAPGRFDEGGAGPSAAEIRSITEHEKQISDLQSQIALLTQAVNQSNSFKGSGGGRGGSPPLLAVNQDHIPLSFEEKTKLSNNIDRLIQMQPDALSKVLEIIPQSQLNPGGDAEEIEIDFESLSTKVLRDLQRYVDRCFRSKKGGGGGVARKSAASPSAGRNHNGSRPSPRPEETVQAQAKRLNEMEAARQASIKQQTQLAAPASRTTPSATGGVSSSKKDTQSNSSRSSESDSDSSSSSSSSSSSDSDSDEGETGSALTPSKKVG